MRRNTHLFVTVTAPLVIWLALKADVTDRITLLSSSSTSCLIGCAAVSWAHIAVGFKNRRWWIWAFGEQAQSSSADQREPVKLKRPEQGRPQVTLPWGHQGHPVHRHRCIPETQGRGRCDQSYTDILILFLSNIPSCRRRILKIVKHRELFWMFLVVSGHHGVL